MLSTDNAVTTLRGVDTAKKAAEKAWKVEIGKRIKRARESAGVGLRQLMREAQVSNLGAYEDGERSPGAPQLARIAKRLDVHADWILFGTMPMRGDLELPKDRYPGRAAAIAAGRLLGMSEEAIAELQRVTFKGKEGQDVQHDAKYWFDELQFFQQKVERES